MTKSFIDQVVHELEDQKAINITPIDVTDLTSVTDHMVIASGTSVRHVTAIADNLIKQFKNHGIKPLSYQRDPNGDWMLVDFGDVIVHVMHPRTREFYNLEKLWGPAPETSSENRSAV